MVVSKNEWSNQWPNLIGLLIQTLIFAFFVGMLYANVEGLKEDIIELKRGIVSVDRVLSIEGRVERIDNRVITLEHEK